MPDEPASDHLSAPLSACTQSLRDFGPLPPASSAGSTTGADASSEAGHSTRQLFVLDEVHTVSTPTDATWRALLGRWGYWAGRRRDESTGQPPA